MKLFFNYKVLLISFLLFSSNFAIAKNWSGWRGPRGDGTCAEQDVPTNWEPAGALWKTGLPGKGHASPIVWSDRVLTVTAYELGESCYVSPAISDGRVYLRGFRHLFCIGSR